MRRHIPHVTILALAVAVAACTGSGSADPTSPPTSSPWAPSHSELPPDVHAAIASLYAGDALEPEREAILNAIVDPGNSSFQPEPGSTTLSNIQLIDATQDCLFVRYVQDSRDVISLPQSEAVVERIALFQPKPEIDASGTQPTPWQLTNRAVPEDVSGGSCE
ncbi:hypothetical protein [Salsipaludibacter albus]|uniref:hypothetical protein n=1 Tax=Salsipaludibacter albus TaxID=2849650 RepID=UPI001EE4A332|nr:hypothetical protein [Salsipaludibacter albus]MBY5162157.1 hypothetical protein [Salsipaludibacter albus]